MLFNLGLEDAQKELLKYINILPAESVSIFNALYRVSAVDVLAYSDIPSSILSAVDGFAVRPGEEGKFENLLIQEYLKLGQMPIFPLFPGQAVGVLTGGPVPDETFAVIPHEKTQVRDGCLTSLEIVKPGNNLKQVGEDYHKGELLVAKGTRLTPSYIALLATHGHDPITVYRKPRVAIISTGSNIVSCNYPLVSGEIRDSNGPLLASLVRQDGGEISAVELTGQKNDEEFKHLFLNLLEQSDLLISTGGTYTSDINQFKSLLNSIGAQTVFREVPIQPGSHNSAAFWNSCAIISLSGNPAACAVGYYLFAGPVLKALQGTDPNLPRISATCSSSFTKKTGSRRFIRAQACCGQDGWRVSILPGQKPSMIRSLINCNALIDLPAGHSPLEPGSEVSIILLDQSL